MPSGKAMNLVKRRMPGVTRERRSARSAASLSGSCRRRPEALDRALDLVPVDAEVLRQQLEEARPAGAAEAEIDRGDRGRLRPRQHLAATRRQAVAHLGAQRLGLLRRQVGIGAAAERQERARGDVAQRAAPAPERTAHQRGRARFGLLGRRPSAPRRSPGRRRARRIGQLAGRFGHGRSPQPGWRRRQRLGRSAGAGLRPSDAPARLARATLQSVSRHHVAHCAMTRGARPPPRATRAAAR